MPDEVVTDPIVETPPVAVVPPVVAAAAGDGPTPTQEQVDAQAARAALDAKAVEDAAKAADKAPEAYTDFTAPDDAKLDPTVETTFKAVAKELNLSQTKAQSLVDKIAPVMVARAATAMQEAQTARVAEWKAAALADKEFGGDKLEVNLAAAKLAMEKLNPSKEFSTFLAESGLGNHPEMIRLLYNASKNLTTDGVVVGAAAPAAQGDMAERLYGKTSSNKAV